MLHKFCVFPLMAILTGCVSVTESNYFTLDMRSSGQVESSFALEDVRIRPGEAVSRPEIMIRTSPTEVEYYATQRWAANLGEQLGEKLKSEFGEPSGASLGVTISGTLLAFEQIDTAVGADARIKLDIYVSFPSQDGESTLSFSRIYETVVRADEAAASAVVRALSRGLESIAAELAGDLARARSQSVE